MTISYSATGLTQTGGSVTLTTSGASTLGANTVTFTSTTNVVAGMMAVSPASMAGNVVTQVNGNILTFERTIAVSLADSTQVAFQDADGILAPTAGATVTTLGTGVSAQRLVALTGTTGSGQFIINGSYNIDAKRNTYSVSSNGTWKGITVNSGGVLNISGTNTGHLTGTAVSTGTKGIIGTVQSTNAGDTGTGTLDIQGGGTVNMNGVSWYGNGGWSLQISSPTAAATLNISNSSIRLGQSTGGASTIYTDAATTNAHVVNFNNVFLNGYIKLVSIASTSTFNGVTWYKDTYAPYTYNASDIAIVVAPNSTGTNTPNTDTNGWNMVGPRFGIAGNPTSYYNTHLAVGALTGRGANYRVATRSTIYGYERGVAPRVGKIYDFGGVNTHRPWIEFRKNIAVTVTDTRGIPLGSTAANTYFEDSQQNTGALQVINISNPTNAGYPTPGTYQATVTAPAGGTNATIEVVIGTVAVATGAGTATVNTVGVQSARVVTGGSGFVTAANTPISVTVNSSTFTSPAGIGTPTAASTLTIYASRRYAGEASSGCPTVTDNRFYVARTNASGVLNTTSTNSQNFNTTISNNPPVPTAGTVLTGIDVMTGIANCSINTANVLSSASFPVDQRFSANADPNWSLTIPVRGYNYEDGSITVTSAGQTTGTGAEDVSQTINRTLALAGDDYAVATGITETAAAAFSDITLRTDQPLRSPLFAGATQGSIIPTTTGTLTFGSISRSLDQLYAKAKRDYVQPVLNETSGTVARTGFGMAQFLTPAGTLTNASLSLGNWAISAGSATLTAGTVFKTLTTTGDVIMYGGQITSSNAANPPNIIANNITLGLAGTPASWRTNSTLGTGAASTGATTFTANIPSGLGLASSVTTGSVNITGTIATDAPLIQAALQSAVNSANINTQVAVSQVLGAATTISFTITADGSAGWVRNGLTPRNITFTNLTGIPANTVVGVDFAGTGGFSTGAQTATGIVTSLNANSTFSANWIASNVNSGTTGTVFITARLGGPTANTDIAVNLTFGGNGSRSTPAITQGTLSNNLQATFTAPTPAVAGVVPTAALRLTSSNTNYITATTPSDNLVNSVAGVAGTTVYQSFTPTNAISQLPSSGLVLGVGGALLSGGTNSNYTIMMGGIPANPMTFASGQDSIRTKNINATGGARTLQIAAMELYEGVLNVTTDSNDLTVSMVGNTIGSNNLVINQLGGTGRVVVTISGNTGGTITAGTGNVVIESALVVTFDATSNGGTLGVYNGATLLANAQLSAAVFPASQLISYAGSATHVTFTRAATQIIDTVFPPTGTLSLTGLVSTPASDPTPALPDWSFLFNNTSIPGVYHGYLVVGSDATSGFITAQNVVALMGQLNFNKYIRFGVNQGYTIAQLFSNTDNQTITLSTTLMRIQSNNPMSARQVFGITGDGVTITNVETDLVDRLVVGGTTSTFPQVRVYPNTQATLGDVRQAVTASVAPMFTKLDAGVVDASLLVPYPGSTYP